MANVTLTGLCRPQATSTFCCASFVRRWRRRRPTLQCPPKRSRRCPVSAPAGAAPDWAGTGNFRQICRNNREERWKIARLGQFFPFAFSGLAKMNGTFLFHAKTGRKFLPNREAQPRNREGWNHNRERTKRADEQQAAKRGRQSARPALAAPDTQSFAPAAAADLVIGGREPYLGFIT